RSGRDHRVVSNAAAESDHPSHLHEYPRASGLSAIGARDDLRHIVLRRLAAVGKAFRREVRSSNADRRARGSVPIDDGRLADRGAACALRDAHVMRHHAPFAARPPASDRPMRSVPWLAFLALAFAALPACDRGGELPAVQQAAAQAGAAESLDARIAAESARLTEWLDARYEEQLDFSPMEKTRLGRKDDYDEIDDFSESAVDAEL